MALLLREKNMCIDDLCERLFEHTRSPECLCKNKSTSLVAKRVNRFFGNVLTKKSYEMESYLDGELDIVRLCKECSDERDNICSICEIYKSIRPSHRHGDGCIINELLSQVYKHQKVCHHLPSKLKEKLDHLEKANTTYEYQNLGSLSGYYLKKILTDGFRASDCIFCDHCKYCSENISCKTY